MNRNDYNLLSERVLKWGKDKGILDKGDSKTQCLKMASEAGELCDAIAKGNREETIDAIGDVMVTLIILARMENLCEVECLTEAYCEIAGRKGKMVNGSFVKDV